MSRHGDPPTVMLAILLIVGLIVGAGVGYFMAPHKDIDEPDPTPETQPPAETTIGGGRHNHLGIWLVLTYLIFRPSIKIIIKKVGEASPV